MKFIILTLFLLLTSFTNANSKTLNVLGVSLSGEKDDRNIREYKIINLIFKCMGSDFKIENVPYGRHLLLYNESKDYDVITTVPPNEKLKGYKSNSHIKYINGVSVLKDSKLNIRTLKDLKNLNVISFVGASELIPEIKENMKLFKSYNEINDQESHSKLLFLGRADAVISDGLIFQSYNMKLRQKEPSKKEFQKKTKFFHILQPSKFSLYFKDKILVDKFNSCLKKEYIQKKIDRINYQYLMDMIML